MQSRSLGRTDIRLGEITLGTWGLAEGSYGAVEPGRLDAVVGAALDAGVTSFDVAPLWGDGEAERRVGAALAGRDEPELAVITRAGLHREGGLARPRFEADALVEECEASLGRLGREQVELWLLHNPGDEVLRQEGWRSAIDRLEQDGKIRAWGVSVGDADEARLALAAGAQALCLPYSMLTTQVLDDLVVDITRAGCGVLARSPLLYGMLAGQWSSMKQFDATDHRTRRWGYDAFTARVRQTESLRFLAGPNHPDLATAALRFVLANPLVTTTLVGARTDKQIRHAAASAASGPPYMSDDDLARVTKVLG